MPPQPEDYHSFIRDTDEIEEMVFNTHAFRDGNKTFPQLMADILGHIRNVLGAANLTPMTMEAMGEIMTDVAMIAADYQENFIGHEQGLANAVQNYDPNAFEDLYQGSYDSMDADY